MIEIIAAFYTFLNQEFKSHQKNWTFGGVQLCQTNFPASDVSPLALIDLYSLPDLNLLVTQSISRGQ
jgi:hypothetical protein